jgi:hypothetical protein
MFHARPMPIPQQVAGKAKMLLTKMQRNGNPRRNGGGRWQRDVFKTISCRQFLRIEVGTVSVIVWIGFGAALVFMSVVAFGFTRGEK